MKKAIFLVLIAALLLVGCGPSEDISDEEMATRVAQILTEEIPTETESPTDEIALMPQVTDVPQQAASTTTPEVVAVVLSPTPTATVPTPTATITQTLEPTDTLEPTPTNTPEPTLTPPGSDPARRLGPADSKDPMSDANLWGWPVGEQDFTKMEFEDGKMVFTGLTNVAGWRLPQTPAGTDMYIEMNVTTGECFGEDNYGIMFRIPVFYEADRGYLFSVSCDGRYRLIKWDGKEGTSGQATWLSSWKADSHIKAGANQTNRIGVLVNDDHFYLYANGFLLNSTYVLQDLDNPYPGGHFGAFVTSKVSDNFTIYIDDMSYWLRSYKP